MSGSGEADRLRSKAEAATSGYEGPVREDLEQLRLPRDAEGSIRTRRPRHRGWLVAGVSLALLAVLAGVLLARRPVTVETVRATPLAEVAGEPVPVLSGTGYLVPAQPFIAVGSRVAGRIERYLVDEGDRVKAGQPMVELDATPFRAVADQARASLVSARAQRQLADADLARAEKLSEQGVLSKDALERRQSEARVARARVTELEAALQRTETDLSDSVIRAPTDGVVLETYKQPGEIAVPGGFSGSGDLLRLANLSELRAQLDVNESDVPRVHLGQRAEVVADAFPDARYAARVVKLAPQIDRQKGTREVEVRVLEPDEKLLPDMSVRVEFFAALPGAAGAEAGSGSSGAVVPRGALRRDESGRPFLWIASKGRSVRVPVELGETLGDRVVVREGLAGGETVIVGEPPQAEGERVVPQQQDGG